jgi:hypothetical protein
MSNGMVLGLVLMAALIVAEVVLSMTWNRFYFTKGIPIFWRRIESTEKLETLSLEALQKASATAAGAPFAFRPLTSNAIAFRERPLGGMMHYMPLMRGLIRHNPEEPFISVLGLVNWSFLGLVIFLLAMLGRKVGIIALYLVGVLAVLYFIQAIRFGRIAKAVRKQPGQP